MRTPDNWLRLDERSNALDNLRMFEHVLRTVRGLERWKWVVITMHQALYGYAVAAVQGTDANSVLQNPNDPRSKLIPIWEAIRRAKDASYLWPGSVPLQTSQDEDRAIDRVVSEFRNGFEHFAPVGWSIEVSGMPTLVGRVLRVIEGIAIETNSVRYYEEGELAAVVATIARLKELLAASAA
jgi:hypothetical protein